MLSDEVRKQKKNAPELVMTERAACRYCGQIAEVEILVNWGVAEAETVATELCDCKDAKVYTHKMRSRENAKKRVRQLFCDDTIADSMHQDIVSFLCCTVDAVADRKIEKASLDIRSGIKAMIANTKNGNIKVRRIITNDASFEE